MRAPHRAAMTRPWSWVIRQPPHRQPTHRVKAGKAAREVRVAVVVAAVAVVVADKVVRRARMRATPM
jgi:hypothetical protein